MYMRCGFTSHSLLYIIILHVLLRIHAVDTLHQVNGGGCVVRKIEKFYKNFYFLFLIQILFVFYLPHDLEPKSTGEDVKYLSCICAVEHVV